MIIDIKTMTKLEKIIKDNIKAIIILHKEKLYKEFAQNNILIKKEIVFNSIAYAKIHDDRSTLQETYQEENGDITISDDVPDSFIYELFNYIDIVLEESKEIFYIDPLQRGRYDLLLKGVIYYIKIINSHLQNQKITFPSEIAEFIKSMPLKKAVELYFNQMIDSAITFCKCYEANSANNKMCKEVLKKDFTEFYKYQYKLDELTTKKLQEDINLIVNNLENKIEYTKKMNGNIELSKVHLSDTIDFAKKFIHEIIDSNKDLQSKKYDHVIKTFEHIFANSKKRFQNSKQTTSFLTELRKSNMFHRMPYNNKVIYPFVYDLIVMGFVYSVHHLKNKETYTNNNLLAKVFNDTKYEYLDKESDENYLFNEFTRFAEKIPQEFKILDEPIIVIIKHYSEFLNCKYEEVANVFRQLRFESTLHKPNDYNLLQDQKGIQLDLDDDYFRKLSLFII